MYPAAIAAVVAIIPPYLIMRYRGGWAGGFLAYATGLIATLVSLFIIAWFAFVWNDTRVDFGVLVGLGFTIAIFGPMVGILVADRVRNPGDYKI